LSGTAQVPEDATEGEDILRVCLPERCDIDVVFTVLTGDPTTTVSSQTTATTTPSSSIASSSTSATVPGEDECALAPESLGVEPAGGDPGAEVAVSFVAGDPIPRDCPVIIHLGGEQVSPQILLTAGAQVDLTIVVPDGIAVGLSNLEVTDPRDQRVLGAVGFEVGGSGVSWIPVAAVAGAVLLLVGGGYVLWRILHPKPPPSGSLMPRFDVPAGVVAGEPFEARLRFDEAPSEPLEVQFAADGYLAPQGLRHPVVVGGTAPATASAALPLVAEPAESPEVRRVVAYLFQQGHLVGWAQTSPTVVPPGAPLPSGLATAAATPLGNSVGPPPDLTLTLTRAGNVRYLDWGFGSPHPVALPRTRVTTDLEQDDARAFAHDAVLSVAQTEPGFIRMKLAGVSKVIGGRIPSETWRTLESVVPFATAQGRTPVLLLVSEEPYVPWDLAMVPESLRLDPGSPPLLGCQLVTGRWMPPDATDGLNPGHPTLPPPVEVDVASMAVVVHQAEGGAAPLPAALEEAERLRSEYGAVVVPARVDEVAALLEERYRAGGPVVLPDVLHLACHGEADPASPSRSGLLLWAGPGNWTSLGPDVLRGAPLVGDRHPFVFINACEAGTPLQGLDGFGGLVGACLKEGARGVIAPLWKVGDRRAAQVATGFYEHVLAGTDRAGDAMRLLRSDPHHEEPVWDRDLLAYTYFGHPMLRLVGHDPTD
jgi:hypothetical protein